MAYLVFARKYRPQTFGDVVGQAHVTTTLSNALMSGRLAHAILLSGPRGTGKTTIARILAKCVNCSEGPTATPCNECRSCKEITAGNGMDVLEIDGASNNKVENVREIRENAKYRPAHSPYKIYIIDEVHMLTDAAFNALLKVLEEPPEHVIFIFATTEARKIPITILSRCQRHDLRRIGIDAIAAHMKTLCAGEKIGISEQALALIAREADGSIRDGLSLLDQVITCSSQDITDKEVIDILGVIDRQVLFDISEALFSGNMAAILDICDALYRQGRHLMKFYAALMEHFRNLLIVKMEDATRDASSPGLLAGTSPLSGIAAHERALMAEQVKNISQPYLFQALDVLFEEEWRIKQSASPRTALEMTFFRLMQIKPAFSMDTLIEKLDRIKTGMGDENLQQVSAPRIPGPATPPCNPPDARPSKDHDLGEAGLPDKNMPETAGIPPSTENFSTKGDPADLPPGELSENSTCSNEALLQTDTDETWSRLKQWICSKSPGLGACLADGALSFEPPDRILIEIISTHPNISLLQKKKNIAAVEKHCHDFFQKPLKVFIDAKQTGPDRSSLKKKQHQLESEARAHPLVNAAIKTFNGKIQDIKVL